MVDFLQSFANVLLVALLCLDVVLGALWDVPKTGLATITHYTQPLDYLGSCGCAPKSTHYPTAALSSLAFGSTQNYGPGCGACYKLTLLNSFRSTPPFYPDVNPSLVVKVTELCPTWSAWCEATPDTPNQAGNFLNFDLAFPSPTGAIPEDFFPHNESFYGYKDFGVWNATYEAVPCQEWAGSSDAAAMGSVDHLGDSVCCSYDPLTNVTCPSFSEQHGDPVPPTFTGGSATHNYIPLSFMFSGLFVVIILFLL